MNLATPAGRVSPATADTAEAVKRIENDDEYQVEPAPRNDDDKLGLVVPAEKVEPAIVINDPRQFAPMEKLQQKYRSETYDVPVAKLRETGITFEGLVGISKGLVMTLTRLTLGKVLPALYNDRDFVSYGEIERYIAVKNFTIFVYAEETSPTPLYTIPLGTLKAIIEDPHNPHERSLTVSPLPNTNKPGEGLVTVILLDDMDALAFQFTFDIYKGYRAMAEDFVSAVTEINLTSKTDGNFQMKTVEDTKSKDDMKSEDDAKPYSGCCARR